ncbi:MAG: hypothetical protein JXR96_12550, partial [Deltaproteobacteria bacterium]|nr:hypothetical protein [Deltaproteobacteria bacterium]
PGDCGCGMPETDSDSDGTPDCIDGCPDDPGKTAPGICGCGVPDEDRDSDGTLDCNDCAPYNPAVYPGAIEACNGIDDNCDAEVDEVGCPCAVAHWHGHSYMLCSSGLGWRDARIACRTYGYDLATIDCAEENAALWALIRTELGDVDTWHGFNDRGNEGVWRWTSDWSAVYTNWASGQPDDFLSSEDCGIWTGLNGEWNDIDCNNSLSYVCESDCGEGDSDGDGYGDVCDCGPIDPHRYPGATEICNGKDDDCDGVIDGIASCPCQAAESNRHVYYFCDSASSWDEARDSCLSYNAHLVTIDDATENSMVRDAMDGVSTGDFWIGYNDRSSEGTWVWDDGSTSSYHPWSTGEPNGADAENCAMVQGDGHWNDMSCNYDRAFVCEMVICEADVHMDLDGDGICGDVDTCPLQYNPDQAGPCHDTSCKDLLDSGQSTGDGIYWISPDPMLPMRVWCDMSTDGGGWTLVATYGYDGRPAGWYLGSYPRPGATYYGWADGSIFDPSINSTARIFSVYAAPLWAASNGEVMAYVGGSTDDYVTASLPGGCNYFDPTEWCMENTYGPFNIEDSTGSVLTTDGYACTTAHGQGAFGGDQHDEFGLHLLDGIDNDDLHNCSGTASALGFEDLGRVFTTFESSDGSFWRGVHSYWKESGETDQPGALLIR